MEKKACLDFNKCDPKKCSFNDGKCIVIKACKKKVIIQEEECPLNAIDINT